MMQSHNQNSTPDDRDTLKGDSDASDNPTDDNDIIGEGPVTSRDDPPPDPPARPR